MKINFIISVKRGSLLSFILCSGIFLAQTWNINGNTGTNSATAFVGTTDNQDFILKTNNVQRLKVSSTGSLFFDLNTLPGSDGIDIISNTQNLGSGTDLMWIKSNYAQANDVGLLTISNSIWQTPIFSARENGKIFIGTSVSNFTTPNCTDCAAYRLFVKDGIRTEKIKVDVASTNGWADFVFDENYVLPTLTEVENHIQKQGHLPNVPSTEEVLKNGVNLGEMTATLLQKIEELTLYSIQQNKQIQQLINENKVLKTLTERVEKLEVKKIK